MAKVAVPINRLRFEAHDTFTNEVIEVFMDHDAWNPSDPLTFTGRVEVDGDTTEGMERRAAIEAALAARFDEEQVKRLIGLLDDYDWDVSFLVDCW